MCISISSLREKNQPMKQMQNNFRTADRPEKNISPRQSAIKQFPFFPVKKETLFLFRLGLLLLALFILIFSVFLMYVNEMVADCGALVYHTPDEVPERRVGLLLGTGKHLSGTRIPNSYFVYRIQAAAELYHCGKISKILVSGDNGRKEYNEPEDMMKDLVAAGVPREDIVCDYAGFRTLDSILRAKKVFGQDHLTVISQQFHCERAIYIARCQGMDVIGYAARETASRKALLRRTARETLSRMAAWLDLHILKTSPRFYGETLFF